MAQKNRTHGKKQNKTKQTRILQVETAPEDRVLGPDAAEGELAAVARRSLLALRLLVALDVSLLRVVLLLLLLLLLLRDGVVRMHRLVVHAVGGLSDAVCVALVSLEGIRPAIRLGAALK